MTLIPPTRHSNLPGDASWRIFYDTDCGICSRMASWMARQRTLVYPRWLAVSSEEANRVVPDRPQDEMAVVSPDGDVWFGGDAVLISLWTLTRYRWLARLFALPGVRTLILWSYRPIARRRRWISKLLFGETCQIP